MTALLLLSYIITTNDNERIKVEVHDIEEEDDANLDVIYDIPATVNFIAKGKHKVTLYFLTPFIRTNTNEWCSGDLRRYEQRIYVNIFLIHPIIGDFRRVALQFPEKLIHNAPDVVWRLEEELQKTIPCLEGVDTTTRQVFITGDTSYG